MTEQMSAALAAAVEAAPPVAGGDKLDAVRGLARRLRDLEREAQDLDDRKKAVDRAIAELQFAELPDAFDAAHMDAYTLRAEGNSPAYEAEIKPYYRANIAADWPDEKRRAAFYLLDSRGAGDLVRAVVSVTFGKRELERARSLETELRVMGLEPEVKMTVPWATLTAWLREEVEVRKSVPPLDVIGGTVGRRVTLKAVKD